MSMQHRHEYVPGAGLDPYWHDVERKHRDPHCHTGGLWCEERREAPAKGGKAKSLSLEEELELIKAMDAYVPPLNEAEELAAMEARIKADAKPAKVK